MDIFDFRSQYTINTEGVFNGEVEQADEVGGLFLRLKNLLTSELHTSWDVAYLEQYISQKMVPRSLRWEVNPQKGEVDLEGWFIYFNDTGVKFLVFLLGKKRDKLKYLNDEVALVRDKLLQFKDQEIYKSKSDQLRQFLEKEDSDQRNKKKKKYNRDLADYSNKMVFKWQIATDEPTESEIMDTQHQLPSLSAQAHLPSGVAPLPATQTNNRGHPSTKPKTFKGNAKPISQGGSRYGALRGPPLRENNRGNYASKPTNKNFQQSNEREYRDIPRGHPQRSRDFERDPRDYAPMSHAHTPRSGGIPLSNRFTPLSYHQDNFEGDEHVISRHPNHYDDYSNPGRNNYQNSPRDFLGEGQNHQRSLPRNNYRGKRGHEEREALEGGGGSGPKRRRQ